MARRAYHGASTILLEFLAKDHYINALADEEMKRYVTLGRTRTLDKAIELVLEYEATTKVEEFRKRSAIHTISTDATNGEKENEVNYIKTTENISLSLKISKIMKELGQAMTITKAIVEGIQKES